MKLPLPPSWTDAANALAAVLEADYVPVWLNRPLVALGHRKPIDVLAGGGYEELSRLIAALEAPTFT